MVNKNRDVCGELGYISNLVMECKIISHFQSHSPTKTIIKLKCAIFLTQRTTNTEFFFRKINIKLLDFWSEVFR